MQRGGRYMRKEEDDAHLTDTSVDYFGKALLRAGYQYYGSEPLYSGEMSRISSSPTIIPLMIILMFFHCEYA